nr:integrase, catalytic region, zinc finger, CCHC-type, peptidase aspartic, catalytic [Tanacetum cinerariifolium]
MANLSEDIQCAGSDTRPPMLDRTDFASWQRRIRLYCRGKDNGVNILKSIDEGPYKLGTFRETLAESTEGTPQFGLERLGVEMKKGNYSKCEEKECYFEKFFPLASLRHRQVHEKKIRDKRRMRRKWNDAPFLCQRLYELFVLER